MDRNERIDKIKELYKDEISEETIEKLATLFPMYGGTIIARCALDLYDSLTYNEEPQGPNGKQFKAYENDMK